ncbi:MULTISPECIES: hypothetical protein [Rhodobacterales]|uniref:hypothetical protein n=1 Tax=Rhodobacterales TaxID=204455 RepID=UPI0011BDA1C4|nr:MULTISPECIES: hypothetical protein [Rhodobacterales]MDO6592113.1 hypothetical protein [Yoonia sp. 1_MG-2023]
MISRSSKAVFISALALGASGQHASADTSLTSTPISFADATGQTATMNEIAACPFVSDETIIASVQTDFEITRQEVSNTICQWAYNAGFTITVSVEDLAGARPVSERQLNTGHDPILIPQDGPGTNATVLNDTAWDTQLPFAYSFEQVGKLVFIQYFGFKTDAILMRPAADEIARRMGAAVDIEPQARALSVPFEACGVWTDDDIRSAFNAGDQATVAPGARGISTCTWTMFEDGVLGQRTVTYNIYVPQADEKQEYEYDSYVPYATDGETHYLREASSDFGMYVHIITPRPEGVVHTTVLDPNQDPTSTAKTFQQNLLGRMTP